MNVRAFLAWADKRRFELSVTALVFACITRAILQASDNADKCALAGLYVVLAVALHLTLTRRAWRAVVRRVYGF